MKILYYDCFSGISGDMNLGAMVDLGVEENYLRKELKKLNLDGWEISVQKDQRHGINGTRVNVIQTVHEHIHRHPSDIEKIISASLLTDRVKEISLKIFQEVAVAESYVHNIPYEKVHFHEVGAIDSIIDIVGAAICFEKLDPEQVYISTVELGSGMVKCAHGILPVPAPATAEIIKGIPVSIGGVDFEATTPTGAAIVKALGTFDRPLPEHRVVKSGYGIGHRENPGRPNILRVFLAESLPEKGRGSSSFLVECNLDDMNPEWYEHIMERLFESGASDVYLTGIIMKRNRPATKISVMCHAEVIEKVKHILFSESTTLGLRVSEFDKYTLERKSGEIETPFGRIKIKHAYYEGKLVSSKPEYSDCLSAAKRNNITLKEVYRYINELINRENGQGES